MNNVLELKGKRFVQASKQGQNGGAAMNSKKTVLSEHLTVLKSQLITIKEFWRFEKRPFTGVLVSVHYNKVVSKSNRIAGLSPDDFMQDYQQNLINIPSPTIEPAIGVIDTLFDTSVYFSEWVEYHEMVDKSIPRSSQDYRHGTAVSSIIVDGSRLNPWLNDGCGRFRARHFGVAAGSEFSSFTIVKQIKSIVDNNADIKVWNISLALVSEL